MVSRTCWCRTVMEPNVLVFLGNGDGTFQTSRSTSVGDSRFCAGSGRLQQRWQAGRHHSRGHVAGNGDGALRASFTNVAASATVDLNGDGNLDLVVSDNTPIGRPNSPPELFHSVGQGRRDVPTAVNYPAGSDAESLQSRPECGCIPDVVVSNLRAGTVAVLLGNGDGRSRPPSTMPPQSESVRILSHWRFQC